MHAYAAFAVNEHLDYLLADAARQRAAHRIVKPSLRTRIAAGLAGLSALLEGAAATAPIRTPRTSGFPYQS